MNRRKLGSLVCGLILSATVLAKGDLSFASGFESGFAGWSYVNGSWTTVTAVLAAHSGSSGADLTGGAQVVGDNVLTVLLPTSGYSNIGVDYWFKIRNGLEGTDQISAQWFDGTVWQTMASYANVGQGDWQFASFSLPVSAENNADFRLQFIGNLDNEGDRFAIDDVAVRGIGPGVPVPSPTAFYLGVIGICSLFVGRRA